MTYRMTFCKFIIDISWKCAPLLCAQYINTVALRVYRDCSVRIVNTGLVQRSVYIIHTNTCVDTFRIHDLWNRSHLMSWFPSKTIQLCSEFGHFNCDSSLKFRAYSVENPYVFQNWTTIYLAIEKQSTKEKYYKNRIDKRKICL